MTKTGPWILWMAILISLSCCVKTSSNRQAEKSQNEADSNAEENELRPAVGRFEGQMLMARSRKKYNVVLETKIIFRIIPSPRDPTVNISIPKLAGYLRFPILKNPTPEKLIRYQEIVSPLGGYTMAAFERGDYDRSTVNLNLPYTVPKFGDANFGSFQGQLIEGVFVGQWNSRIESMVGTFNLIRVDPPADSN